MIDIETDISSVLEYMTQLNVSFNANSSVQHILETSLAPSSETDLQYTFVLFDLAARTLLLQHFEERQLRVRTISETLAIFQNEYVKKCWISWKTQMI